MKAQTINITDNANDQRISNLKSVRAWIKNYFGVEVSSKTSTLVMYESAAFKLNITETSSTVTLQVSCLELRDHQVKIVFTTDKTSFYFDQVVTAMDLAIMKINQK
jgi:hypothetical protein